jgi:hypothetical protein
MAELSLQTADVIHYVPSVFFFDAIVRWHQAAPVSNHSEDVAVGAGFGHVHRQIDSRHSELRRRSVAHRLVAMTHGAIDLKVFVAVLD